MELFEQFLRSGFSRETAARMINSALVLQRGDGMFSTVDICSIDLYTGVCSFLKAGRQPPLSAGYLGGEYCFYKPGGRADAAAGF